MAMYLKMAVAGSLLGQAPAAEKAKLSSTLKSPAVEVPMRFRGSQPAVEVMVNGQGPFLFAIDTGGAGEARVNADLAKKLKLETIGKVEGGDGSGRTPRTMDLVRLNSLTFSGAEFHSVTAAVRDYNPSGSRLPHIDGILCFGLFAEFTLTLDYPAKQVRVGKTALPKLGNDSVLPFEIEEGVPVVEVKLPQGSVRAHFDTGNTGGFHLPKALAETEPLDRTPKAVGKAKTISGEFPIEQAVLNGSMRIGELRFDRPVVTFSTVFRHANVGSGVFKNLSLAFDQPNRRLRLVRPQQAPKASTDAVVE